MERSVRHVQWMCALCLALLLSACPGNRGDGPTDPGGTGSIESPPPTDGNNVNAPGWVYPGKNKIAVVFVHGSFGDTRGTWTNAARKTFFDYLHETHGVGDKVDIYAFGFTSEMIAGGSLKIGEAANKLHEFLAFHDVDDYEQIVFVAHSMGGLITMRELISHPEIARKTPLLVFYATPHEGSQITNIATHVVNNPAVRQMFPVDNNDYLQQLNEDWVRVKQSVPHPTMVCAYETADTGPTRIVQWSSSTRNCDKPGIAIENTNHTTIVKPKGPEDTAVVVLVNALKEYVMPTMDPAAWDTPDFRDEQGQWTYDIRDINGRNGAVIANRGQIPQRYALELVDAADMVMSPETMPRYVAPGARDEVRLILVNDLKPQYRMKLRLGSSPERMVLARIADMDAAVAARNDRKEATAETINTWLASGDNEAQFKLLPAPEQHQKLAEIADTAIARQHPDLSPSTRLLVTADTLAAMNLSNSAGAALTQMEARYPATAKLQSTRQLAGVVAAQTGRPDVLKTVEVRAVPLEEAAPAAELDSASNAQREAMSQLAERLRTIPATESEALLLRGDVLRASGEQEAAKQAYTEATQVEATPLSRARVRRASEL